MILAILAMSICAAVAMAGVGAGVKTKDFFYWHDSNNASANFFAGMLGNNLSSTTGIAVAGNYQAYPVMATRDLLVDTIQYYVSTAGSASSKCQLCIYANTNDTTLYPLGLVKDGGEDSVGASTAARAFTVNYTLQANVLYWMAFICTNTSGVLPTLLKIQQPNVWQILGGGWGASVTQYFNGYSPTSVTYTRPCLAAYTAGAGKIGIPVVALLMHVVK